MSSPNKNLNQYFAAARAQEPSLPLEELTQQIARHSAGAATGAKASAVAGNKNIFWALGSAGTIGAIFSIWLFAFHNPEQINGQAPPVAATVAAAPVPQPLKPQVASAAGPAVSPAPQPTSAAVPTPITKKKLSEEIVWNSSNIVGREIGMEDPNSLFYNKRLVAVTMKADPTEDLPQEGEKVFGSITLLELPREVEQKLGIEVSEEGILYERLSHDPVEGLVRLRLWKSGGGGSVFIGAPTANWVDEKPVVDSSKLLIPHTSFFPLFMTERNGERRMMYSTDSEDKRKFQPEYFNEMLNSMVPVLVKANNQAKDEAIFWFANTSEFLNNLPQQARQKVEEDFEARGLTAATQQKKGASDSVSSASVKQAAGSKTQQKYFESNRANASSIQYAVVFPNPVSDWVNLSMSLKRAEEMQVVLVDISGRLVRVLSPYKRYTAGSVTEKFNLKGEAKGIYILLAETKSGHRHTQRIIIE